MESKTRGFVQCHCVRRNHCKSSGFGCYLIVVVIVAVAAVQCCRRASFAVVIVDVAQSPSLSLLKVNLPIILLF